MPATKQNTTESAKRKLSLIRLAEELGNVSKACEITGYSRQAFYDIRRAFQVGGMAAFVEKKRGPKNPHPNRVAKEIEEKILTLCLERPTWGAQRIANELCLMEVNVSATGVRGVWTRHDLPPPPARLEGEAKQGDDSAQRGADTRAREALARVQVCHIEANAPGELLNQDTFHRGEGGPVSIGFPVFASGPVQVARSSGAGSDRSLPAHPGEPLHPLPGAFV